MRLVKLELYDSQFEDIGPHPEVYINMDHVVEIEKKPLSSGNCPEDEPWFHYEVRLTHGGGRHRLTERGYKNLVRICRERYEVPVGSTHEQIQRQQRAY